MSAEPSSRAARLYRVFPWLPGARAGDPGHPPYVPRPQGAGRINNPEAYLVLYASDSPVGAVAEAFGNHSVWTEHLLAGRRDMPRSRMALAAYEIGAPVLDLDDPAVLRARGLRPSRVVTRDRPRTQRWALDLFRERRWAGLRWWSYYDPDWGSHGVWDPACLVLAEVVPLTADHPALVDALRILHRPWGKRGSER
ncbi:MAG: RES family NAD+ phosphorylase [Acidobacteria bacterium]|nr:RES family NAD+ phosphorylase [Acidobacteriota bacterium]